ncbi:hypothetical protein M8A51_16505 [Schlegelella sp. S2-27]|uniref:Uncharacterized protein n=1 Tax=Caldimonas mangrovi TaxID=2944811 RepID=A0ABT0YQX3_9BURK|nr:hypothetical protein [Caldimonas mangrovi]MCM5681129.1 hypothetical protein [Caldimonas mangrovi]
MRAVFSLAALLIVLAVIGVLIKQQLSAAKVPVVSAAEDGAAGTQREQVQQQLRQFKSDLNQSLQQGASRNQAID